MLAQRGREGRLLEDLTDSDPERPPSSIDAARPLARLPSVGPYLVKSLLGGADADEAHPLRCRRHTSRTLFVSAVLVDRPPRVDESVAVVVEQGPQGTHHYIEKLGQMGAPGNICREHCAIGLLGAAAVLNKAPFTPTGTNE